MLKYRGWLMSALEYLLHVPWILPAAMIALGLLITYDRPNLLVGGFELSGTVVILLVAFVIGEGPVQPADVEGRVLVGERVDGGGCRHHGPELSIPSGGSCCQRSCPRRRRWPLNSNNLLDDYDTAVFLAPLYQPLGLQIKASADGGASVEAICNTFVYTVVLMVVMGTVVYLVYGRGLDDDDSSTARVP